MLKIHENILINPQTFFCYCFILNLEKMLRDKATIRSLIKINDTNKMDLKGSFFVGPSVPDSNSREGFDWVWISLR